MKRTKEISRVISSLSRVISRLYWLWPPLLRVLVMHGSQTPLAWAGWFTRESTGSTQLAGDRLAQPVTIQ
ncbi:MAG TPA: hypothetical protein V6D03_13780 [Candidatus Caenarcaniphilales bacterium]